MSMLAILQMQICGIVDPVTGYRYSVLVGTVADDYYDWPVITDRVMIARMREEATDRADPRVCRWRGSTLTWDRVLLWRG